MSAAPTSAAPTGAATHSTYVTKDGDVLDHIALRHYGAYDSSAVARLLDANPQLCDRACVLPAGVRLVLPAWSAPRRDTRIRLWD